MPPRQPASPASSPSRPYYNRPSQVGIARHFTAVAEATSLPVIIYDIPVRTGRKVATETLLRLARESHNIVGVKDAAGDVAGSARLLAEAPPGFDLYSGEDSLTLPLLSIGAVGVDQRRLPLDRPRARRRWWRPTWPGRSRRPGS